MAGKIFEVTENKKQHLALLLLADEQEDMIDRYLDKGRLFALDDGGIKCVAVMAELNAAECELKNIAVQPKFQGKGYGKAMMRFLLQTFLGKYETVFVGTGDVPATIGFYESCGFRQSHRIKNFFTENYKEPMFEDGIQLVDMVYLRLDAK